MYTNPHLGIGNGSPYPQLDRSKIIEPKNLEDADLNELDFSSNSSDNVGILFLGDGTSHPIQKFGTRCLAHNLKETFPYPFSVKTAAVVRALPDKTIAITGVVIFSCKGPLTDDDLARVEIAFFDEKEEEDKRVTVPRILSNLCFPQGDKNTSRSYFYFDRITSHSL